MDGVDSINTLNAYLNNENLVISDRGECVLFGARKRPIRLYEDLQFFRMEVEYANSNELSFIVPSYVRFFVRNKKSFISVMNLGKSDILVDYADQMVKIKKLTQIEVSEVQKTYVSICAKYILPENVEFATNFYLNGILTSVPWRNFSGKKQVTTEE